MTNSQPARSSRRKRLPHLASLFVLLGLAGLFGLRDRVGSILAADSEMDTWGASDPAWSPDGSGLAFSLFGSLWQVSSEGGEAVQLTSSAGYHAHPAWSPKGDRIVFIRGSKPPYHRTLNVTGTLVVLDVATGQEQDIALTHPTAGTPAWSPDGTAVVCGLLTPGQGALLHLINLVAHGARKLQYLPSSGMQTGPKTPAWIDATWNWRRNELFFATFRIGSPQIWSMEAIDRPLVVQMPLTRYKPQDIIGLGAVSAIPNGSGAVFSAALPNAAGNFELYRIARGSAGPVNLTRTQNDEFSPAVSPDGKRIAFVSNRLGNIDLFSMPVGGGEQKHIRITGLKFRQPPGRVRVRVFDETGKPAHARLYVRASDGKSYCPPGSPIYYFPLEANQQAEGFYLASGDDSFPVPAGRLRLLARRGVEYRIAERTVEVSSGETTDVNITLERWTNWMQRGWYTGENHFHANYYGFYYQRPRDSMNWLMAEDLNAANMVVANSDGGFVHDKEFFRGAVDPASKDRYVLYWGEEYRNANPYGHMCFLNLKKLVVPTFTSFPGSASPYDYPLNTSAALEARAQGGLVSYTHPMGDEFNDVFEYVNGAREVPIAAALGALDAIDLLPWGDQAYQLWYRLLNCGFRIAPGAGTDTFTNYRGITRLPGAARQYVEVGGEMDWKRWIERYRQGRAFVTNAPLLTFSLNGEPLGSVIRVAKGQPYSANLMTDVTADVPLRRVEFIQNGEVIESRDAAGARSMRMERRVEVSRSSWFGVRVTGDPTRGGPGPSKAHSGAIYVEIGGEPVLIREDIDLMSRWIDRLWAYLEERNNFGSAEHRASIRQTFARASDVYRIKRSASSQQSRPHP